MKHLGDKKSVVFVGLSGGVDSSVAAARLIDQGYSVVGVFIKVWQPEFLECDSEKDRLDAMRVAAHLQIPFLTLDAALEYKQDVGDYFISEYQRGRTPNPDVMCNRYVKFGAFWKFAKEKGADYIATGHYVRTQNSQLLRGVDQSKDQSYFLWTLTTEDLEHTLFPIGDSTKEEIREEAHKRGLPTAQKKDSQGICFLGHVDIKEFLSHFTSLQSGPVLNESGETIGEHSGALIYTLGQRHGFTIFGEAGQKPHFVIGKDIKSNTVTVGEEPPILEKGAGITLEQVNLVSEAENVEAQIRYRQTPFPARIEIKEQKITLYPRTDIDRPAAGQSVVLYQGAVCLGGGIVS